MRLIFVRYENISKKKTIFGVKFIFSIVLIIIIILQTAFLQKA